VPVDHYAALDMDAFDELATAVGGVPVCLKQATRDPGTKVSFPAGKQTLTGEKVLAFLRQKDDAAIPYPDVAERQEAFLTGLASKAGDVDSQAVLDVLGKRLRTDEDLDVLGLAARLESVKGVRFAEVGADLSVPMETAPGELVLPIVTVKQFVTDMFAGASHPGGPGTPELTFAKQKCVY
jgi:anionic cell wall polymer biosynthesis LytR-Cps2A-Psr (LCP) family protein